MARDMKSTKSFIKLQAHVRGFLVRKKFSQLKQQYNEVVKCCEGDSTKVSWRNDLKLGLPIVVDRTGFNIRGNDDELSVSGRQDTCGESSLKVDHAKQFKRNEYCANETKTPENHGKVPDNILPTDVDFESTNELINSTSNDSNRTNNSSARDSLKGESVLDSTCNSTVKNTCSVPLESKVTGDIVNKDNMFYPSDKASLKKLHEDLTMELLWIEQAIESRINVVLGNEGEYEQTSK